MSKLLHRILLPAEAKYLAPLGASFFQEASLPGVFSEQIFVDTWQALISGGSGVAVVTTVDGLVVAAAGAYLAHSPMTGDFEASEAFFYAMPEHRGVAMPLFQQLESVAKARGAVRMMMIHLSGPREETLRKLYERRGYRAIEHVYTKEL